MTWHKIIIGDSRKVLREISPVVDLIITSPPYFNLKKYPNNIEAIDTSSIEDYEKGLKSIFKECYRVLKEGRFFCIVVGQYTSEKKSYFIPGIIVNLAEEVGFDYKREHIWIKPKGTQGIWNRGTTKFLKNPFPRNTMINIHHEHILVFQKGDELDIKETEKLSEEEVKEYCWSGWQIPVSQTKGHPAPFPEEIPQRLIKMYSYSKEIVLDPFLGSGTTSRAAGDLYRNSIGIEVNSKYLPLIKESLRIGLQEYGIALQDQGRIDYEIVRFDKGEKINFRFDKK